MYAIDAAAASTERTGESTPSGAAVNAGLGISVFQGRRGSFWRVDIARDGRLSGVNQAGLLQGWAELENSPEIRSCGLVVTALMVNLAHFTPLSRSMNIRRLLLSLAALSLGLGHSLAAADKAAESKNGYTVVLDLKVTEAGAVEDAIVVTSDDTSVDHILDRMAMEAARVTKVPPHLKDGKAVKFTARAPFLFTVEDDEGPDANKAPKPSIHSAEQPIFPAELAAKGEVGGVILEAVIGVDGKISSLKVIRSSHVEFAMAATTAVKQWTFIPAKKDGVAVESRWRLAISFESDVLRADWKWRFAPRPALGNYSVVHRTLPSEPVAMPPQVPVPAQPAAK